MNADNPPLLMLLKKNLFHNGKDELYLKPPQLVLPTQPILQSSSMFETKNKVLELDYLTRSSLFNTQS